MPIKDFVISVTQTRGQTGACCGTFKAQTLLRSVAICFIEGGKERRCCEEDGNRGMRRLCDWLLESRACWLPCLGDMQGTYVVLEPLGWHWRWGKTGLQGKCFPWSQPATAYTARLIDESPVDLRMLRFTHKRKGQLTKCYQLRLPWLNTRLHTLPHKTRSFHHISLEEIHNHMLYMHLRLRLELEVYSVVA